MRKINWKDGPVSKILTVLVVGAFLLAVSIWVYDAITASNIRYNAPDPTTGLSKRQRFWHDQKQERADLLLSDIEYVRDEHGIVYVCVWNFDINSPNGKYPVAMTALSAEDAQKIPEKSIWTAKKSP